MADDVKERMATPGALENVALLIRDRTGHDFSQYKQSTFLRRIERRMAAHRLERVEDYVRFLRGNPREVERLFLALLIGVTGFFRDPEAFEALRTVALPLIFQNRSPADTIRIWAAGCSTGEEAYSLAILFREYLEEHRLGNRITIFATDIDPVAIETARAGRYPREISGQIGPERLERFFISGDDGYRIRKEIRESVIFAPQSIIKDPPFIRLDLVSCRNLLIYLDAELQRKVLPLLHFSLGVGGILFLGSSETVGRFTELFAPVDRKWKIYRTRDIPIHELVEFPISSRSGGSAEMEGKRSRFMNRESIRVIVERILLREFTPPGVLVDEKGDILFIFGKTGKFLDPASGEPTLNILEMAREGLKMFLSTALRQAVEKGGEVRFRDIRVRTNGGYSMIRMTALPVGKTDALEGALLVVFEEEADLSVSGERSVQGSEEQKHIAQLERELAGAREYLQTTIEEMETSHEELKSSNEELQSANEEMQSANEELETSREELQSVNEELVTLNSELNGKIEELSRVNGDMNDLLAGTEIAIIFLDRDLKIKRFTPAAGAIINMIPADVDRSLGHLVTNLKYQGLVRDAGEVMETLGTKEREVQGWDGRWYFMRIIPYAGGEEAAGGVVITLVDITGMKRREERRRARLLAGSMADAVRGPFAVLDAGMRLIAANGSFRREFGVNPEDAGERALFELGDGQWDIPALRDLLDAVIRRDEAFEDYRVECDWPGAGRRIMLLNARKTPADTPEGAMVLLAVEDVTGKEPR